MRFKALAVFVALSLALLPVRAHANRCGGIYHGINRVVWSIDKHLPTAATPENWDHIEAHISKELKRVIEDKEMWDNKLIEIRVLNENEDTESKSGRDPATLYVKIQYSYASKSAFSSPLDDDALVVRVVTTRRLVVKERSVDKIAERTFPWHLYPLHKNSGKIDEYSFNAFSDLRDLGCTLLGENTEWVCTDPTNPFTNRIERRPGHCEGPDTVH